MPGLARLPGWFAALALLAAVTGVVAVLGGFRASSGSRTQLVFHRFDLIAAYDYTLGCDPVSGTLPNRAAVCAALARDPALVTTRPGAGHSCPAGGGMTISGTFDGARAHTIVSSCFFGLEQLESAWSKLLPPVPRVPLQVESGDAFTPGPVLSHGPDGFRLRYRHGERFALAFPVKNISSSPLTITWIEGLPTSSSLGGSPAPYPNTPQLVVPTGATLTPLPAGRNRPAKLRLAPVTTKTPVGITVAPGATIELQEDFTIGTCGTVKSGTVFTFNRQIPVGLHAPGASGGEWIPNLPANWITLTVPANCVR